MRPLQREASLPPLQTARASAEGGRSACRNEETPARGQDPDQPAIWSGYRGCRPPSDKMDDVRIQASSGYWTFIEDGEQRRHITLAAHIELSSVR